jgi:hypothetical protein
MLMLITAFTIGHSLTLALSVFQVLTLNMAFVEFLIALTIVITCLYNIRFNKADEENKNNTSFWMAACFGLIHGLGFASVLKEMLFDDHILLPLFSFNVGLEVGQLFIVIILFSLMHFFRMAFHLKQYALNLFISAGIAIIACVVAINRFTILFHN